MAKRCGASTRESAARRGLREIGAEALSACDPAGAVERAVWAGDGRIVVAGRSIGLRRGGRLLILGFGKAAAAMTRGLLGRVREAGCRRLVRCLVIGSGRGRRSARTPVSVESLRGEHPIPGRASYAAGRRAIRFLAGVTTRDDVIFLASGGGSSMMAAPLRPFVSPRDKATLHRALVVSGAPVEAINAVRRPFSAVKGGRLALAARRARTQTTLLVSDVDPDRIEDVASGPSLPDRGGIAAAVSAIDRYGLAPELPASLFRALRSGRLPKAPGPDHPAFRRAGWESILTNRDLRDAAVRAGRTRGLAVESSDVEVTDPVESAAVRLSEAIARAPAGDRLLVLGGEVTTRPSGKGIGGRAHELALRLALRAPARGSPDWAFLALCSDGRDGNAPSAGAYVDATTLRRASAGDIDLEGALGASDSHTPLARLGDDFLTGPTGTNVRDLYLLLTARPEMRGTRAGMAIRRAARDRRPPRRGSRSPRHH